MEGDRFDLEDLPAWFGGEVLAITEVDGQFFLTSSDFDKASDAQGVEAAAIRLLPIVNGMGRLQNQGFRDVGVDSVVETRGDGTNHWHVTAAAGVTFRAKVSASPEAPPDPHPTWQDRVASLAMSNTDVAEVLEIWASASRDGPSLYHVLEIIGSGTAKELTSSAEVRRFTGSVNRSDVFGKAARHRRPKGDPPRRTMTEREAIAFIEDLMDAWITSLLDP
jgi:hypothetical protein